MLVNMVLQDKQIMFTLMTSHVVTYHMQGDFLTCSHIWNICWNEWVEVFEFNICNMFLTILLCFQWICNILWFMWQVF